MTADPKAARRAAFTTPDPEGKKARAVEALLRRSDVIYNDHLRGRITKEEGAELMAPIHAELAKLGRKIAVISKHPTCINLTTEEILK